MKVTHKRLVIKLHELQRDADMKLHHVESADNLFDKHFFADQYVDLQKEIAEVREQISNFKKTRKKK